MALEKTFGENLRALRKMRGISQERLAEMVGLSNTSIQSYEYGTRWPAPEIIEDLSKALQAPVESLFGPERVIRVEPKVTLRQALKTIENALQGRLSREDRIAHIPDDILEMLAGMAPSNMDLVRTTLEGVAVGTEIKASRAPHGKKKPRLNV